MSVSAAFRDGDRKGVIAAMAETIANAIDSDQVLSKDLPPLTKRMGELMQEYESLENSENESDDDTKPSLTVVQQRGLNDGEFKVTAI